MRKQERHFQDVPLDEIYITGERRDARPEDVAALAQSIERVGLQEPIKLLMNRVFIDPEEGEINNALTLVAGRHRLEAFRSLGRKEIPAEILYVSPRRARMIEIAENLHRADLTILERREQEAEWLDLANEEDKEAPVDEQLALKAPKAEKKKVVLADGITALPQTAGNKDHKLGQVAPVSKGGRGKESGLRAAARDLGLEHRDARRAVAIAGLSPEAKEVARQTGLDDNQSALLAAAKAAKPVKDDPEEKARIEAETLRKRHEEQEAEKARRAERAKVDAKVVVLKHTDAAAKMICAHLSADEVSQFILLVRESTMKDLVAALMRCLLVAGPVEERKCG